MALHVQEEKTKSSQVVHEEYASSIVNVNASDTMLEMIQMLDASAKKILETSLVPHSNSPDLISDPQRLSLILQQDGQKLRQALARSQDD
eukprot:gb/GEZN01041474.1/.p1 GENE.gb/GEZN01041474.1/~~gb/GEZN01041474.1/.p1  ORF type:complete len:100 (-),score=13.92 gb/GEZN01041474.1/:21-290(-)